ncbi:glucosaminidase domain-containing protein [Bacillus sp. FJAT-28004]|uniref:glucosaminidase domain-containing protein n=1 Tax=Bacillus sp. FJAT-28004 TaxID=1679165 RepID=UPI0006B614ED|nr:glucosaminidase domain-containing protein [Bacillus sp. FJAT-28004]
MPADEAYVLSPTDVRNIRSYVQHKYAAMPGEKRAEIVADAVKRIIHKQLPNFESSIKRYVTETLIKTTVLERQRPVRAEDIFQVCLGLDRTSTDIYDPFHDWLEEQLLVSCKKPLMQRVMDELLLTRDQSGMDSNEAENGLLTQLRGLLASEGVESRTMVQASSTAEVISLPITQWSEALTRRISTRTYIYSTLSFLLIAATLMYGWSLNKPSNNKLQPPVVIKQVQPIVVPIDGLPAELRYQEFDQTRLVSFLQSKSSILAEQPYFDAIITAAQTFDIHPVVLFAITGQEQGFVPKSNKQHKKIANNPFNVFHSWQDFNTDIEQSAEIAARTVFNLSKDRPADVDPFTWINRKYAEDPKWSDGVRTIFAKIIAYMETPPNNK